MIHETKKIDEKAVLVMVSFSNKDDIDFSMSELDRLCETAEVEVVGTLIQKAKEITPATLIGSGKVEELKSLVENSGCNLVIFNNELSGSQTKNVSDAIFCKVIDRTTLILDIFAKRATSNEGKLQVELAQLKYNLPRLSALSGTSGRFGGGVGMRGPGEKKIELDKRAVLRDIQRLEGEIKTLKERRIIKRKQRDISQIKKVAIVGYTNAGKSTLLNTITKASIYADDKLFATLDTTSRKLWLGPNMEVVITDTVGFIDKLPHTFVDAFASTLEEAVDADLILALFDLSDKNLSTHMQVVNDVLKQVGADEIKRINIYNKIDKSANDIKDENGVFISAKKNENIEELKEKIINQLFG